MLVKICEIVTIIFKLTSIHQCNLLAKNQFYCKSKSIKAYTFQHTFISKSHNIPGYFSMILSFVVIDWNINSLFNSIFYWFPVWRARNELEYLFTHQNCNCIGSKNKARQNWGVFDASVFSKRIQIKQNRNHENKLSVSAHWFQS